MALHDHRTKPDTEWTFYAVDNIVTMSNIYRFDTAQEAIDKYLSLPATGIRAIGSSLESRYEIDHIQTVGGRSVLIRDMDRMDNPIWRESPEILAAVKLMREQCHVEHELSGMFGATGNVVIPIAEEDLAAGTYFRHRKLDPVKPEYPLSAINEVFVEGKGWVDYLRFRRQQENRKWSPKTGYPVPCVTSLNIRYADENGYSGQADITPADFAALKATYEKEQTRKPGLDARINSAAHKASTQENHGKDISHVDKAR